MNPENFYSLIGHWFAASENLCLLPLLHHPHSSSFRSIFLLRLHLTRMYDHKLKRVRVVVKPLFNPLTLEFSLEAKRMICYFLSAAVL